MPERSNPWATRKGRRRRPKGRGRRKPNKPKLQSRKKTNSNPGFPKRGVGNTDTRELRNHEAANEREQQKARPGDDLGKGNAVRGKAQVLFLPFLASSVPHTPVALIIPILYDGLIDNLSTHQAPPTKEATT